MLDRKIYSAVVVITGFVWWLMTKLMLFYALFCETNVWKYFSLFIHLIHPTSPDVL